MDTAAALANIKSSVDALHKQAPKPPRHAQALILRAASDLASKAGAHALSAQLVQKAASTPAQTNVAGWASEVVGSPGGQLVLLASQSSAFAAILARSNQVSALGASQTSVTVMQPPSPAAIVSEAAAIPLVAGSIAGLPVQPEKIASITSYTHEQSKRSSIASVARALLTQSLALGIDSIAFAASGPLSVLDGVTPTTPGTTVLKDVEALISALDTPSPDVTFVMSPAKLPLFLASAGERFPYAAIASSALDTQLIAIDPQGVAAAIGDAALDVSTESTLHMDTAPGAIIQGSPTRSAWQTDTLALRAILDAAWAARSGAVAHISTIGW